MPTRFPIFIIDAPSILLHAYNHPASTTVQHPALYTFCKILLNLEKKFKLAHIAIVWDERIPKINSQYLNDKKSLIEYIDSMRMEQLLDTKLTTFDLIFSMIKSFNHQRHDVVIVTADKEMLSLIGDAAKVFDPFKKILIQKKPKTSSEIFSEGHRHPNPTTAARTKFPDKNWKLGLPFFEKNNYKKLITQLHKLLEPVKHYSFLQIFKKNYDPVFKLSVITTKAELKDLCESIKKSKIIGINVQGTHLDPMSSACAGISIALGEKEVFFIPRSANDHESSISLQDTIASLKPLLADENIEKIMHNARFNQIVLSQNNMPLAGKIFDITIAASLIMHNDQENCIEILRDFYTKNATISYQEMTHNQTPSEESVILEKGLWNSVADIHQTMILKNIIAAELKKESMVTLFETIEMPINNVLVAMEIAGIYCDAKLLEKMNSRITKDINKLEEEINSYAPDPINVNSTAQIRKLLFDILKLPIIKKLHKHRQVATDAEALIELSKLHPIASLILRYRKLFKFKHTYLAPLFSLINNKTHKIHAFWEQSLGSTDRISCSHPNLQNMPTYNPGHGMYIRSAFIAKENNIFVAADYKNIELHIIAHLSQDKALQSALLNKENIAIQVSEHLFATTIDTITPKQLSIAQKILTSIAYGLTPYGLAMDQHISIKQAEFAMKKFFEQYSGVETWIKKTIETAQKNLYVTTLFDKRRFIPDLQSKNRIKLDAAKRLAINTIIQGSATEIMKIAMISIHEKINKQKLEASIILNIHDQLVLTSTKNDLEKIEKIIQTAMTAPVSWEHPLQVTLLTGHTWQDVTLTD